MNLNEGITSPRGGVKLLLGLIDSCHPQVAHWGARELWAVWKAGDVKLRSEPLGHCSRTSGLEVCQDDVWTYFQTVLSVVLFQV